MAKKKKTKKKKIVTPKSLEEPMLSETPVIGGMQANVPAELSSAVEEKITPVIEPKTEVEKPKPADKVPAKHEAIPPMKDWPLVVRPEVPEPIEKSEVVTPATCNGCKAIFDLSVMVSCDCKGNPSYCPACLKPKSCHSCGKVLIRDN